MQISSGLFANPEYRLKQMALRSRLLRSLAVSSQLQKPPTRRYCSKTCCSKTSGGYISHNNITRIYHWEHRRSISMVVGSIRDTGTISRSHTEYSDKDTLRYGSGSSSCCSGSLLLTGGTNTRWAEHSCGVWRTSGSANVSYYCLQLQEHLHSTAKWERNGNQQRSREGERQLMQQQHQRSEDPAHQNHHQEPQQQAIRHQLRFLSRARKDHLRQRQQPHQTQQPVHSAFLVDLPLGKGQENYYSEVPSAVQISTAIPLPHTTTQSALQRSQNELRGTCTKPRSLSISRAYNDAHVDSSSSSNYYNTTRVYDISSATRSNLMPCSYAIRCGQTNTDISAEEGYAGWNSVVLAGCKLRWSRIPTICKHHGIVDLSPCIAFCQLDAVTPAPRQQQYYAVSAAVKTHHWVATSLFQVQQPQQDTRRSKDVETGRSHRFTSPFTAHNQRERQGTIQRAQRAFHKHSNEFTRSLLSEGRWHWMRSARRQSSSVTHTKRSDAEKRDTNTQRHKQLETKEQQHSEPTQLQETQATEMPVSTLTVEIADRVGSLCDLLVMFKKFHLNITQIKSTPKPLDLSKVTFSICFQGAWEEPRVVQLLDDLKTFCSEVKRGEAKGVPWFPRCVEDLDKIACQTLDAGADLQADHPGFHDKKYRIRRQEIASLAEAHRTGNSLKHVNYTDEEKKTWEHVWRTLTRLYPACACAEYNAVLHELQASGLYRADDLPQMAHINDYVQSKTGFTFRPVAGLLAAREFLNALAFRVFFSTQYIRHSSVPLYTPEPDVIHELLGHAPLLANPEFAEFSQLIGLASLGASEEDIQKLQRCYWFSVEFGLLLQSENNALRAYGAGLLSSPGELLNATSPTNTRVQVLRWRPEAAAAQNFPVTTFQPVLFAAQSLEDVREQLLRFCNTNLSRPFAVRFDRDRRCVHVSTEVNSKPISLKF